jgi:hypothetical protein
MLRTELLRFPREDGGLDLLDLLFERTLSLSPDEARALAAEEPALMARLESQHWCEGAVVDQMRKSAWAARARNRPAAAPAPLIDADWDEARSLPASVAAAWRDPERLRRLAEERAAGRRFLSLPGFLSTEAAREWARAAAALPFARMDTDLVHAQRCLLGEADLPEWRALMASPIVRRLFGAVLGVDLPERLFINAWRLERDDYMGVHPDGRLYRGTLSLGLNDGWTAADGGAIAFGDPTGSGFVARERWLPHAGDALLFAPARDSWHTVEPVLSGKTRYSLTGWWTLG